MMSEDQSGPEQGQTPNEQSIDVTERTLELYLQGDFFRQLELDRKKMTASLHPQAALMFAKLAHYHSKKIDGEIRGFYDFDHAVNFQALANCLSFFVDSNIEPSFEEALAPDENVRKLFAHQIMDELNRHQHACLLHGVRRSYYDSKRDRFLLGLTKRRRMSMLQLVDVPAQSEALDQLTGGLLSSGKATGDDVMFALARSDEQFRYVREADPGSWRNFETAAGFTFENLTAFSAFLVFLEFAATEVGHSLWYDKAFLLRLSSIFCEAYSRAGALPDEKLLHLVDTFSLAPSLAAKYLLPVPFFRIGDRYLRCPNYLKTMSPAMSLLTIAIRQHESAWSRTVGATLAYAADVVAKTLPAFGNILTAVRRGIKGKGDIDLAMYDSTSQTLLICEVKTVYDKHRTVRQMQLFEESKVNLSRAVSQLRSAIEVVKSGAIGMEVIFGAKLAAPLRVEGALLTWVDPIDLTIGTPDEDLLSLNFATLGYLLRRSGGDLAAMLRATSELRNLWCVARRRPIDLQIPVTTEIDVQLPLLDAPQDIKRLNLSPLAMEEVRRFPALPDGWKIMPEFGTNMTSYFQDSLSTLVPG